MTLDFHNGVRMADDEGAAPMLKISKQESKKMSNFHHLLQGTVQLNKQYYPLRNININTLKPEKLYNPK